MNRATSDLSLGTTLAERYRVTHVLGSGATGVTYAAERIADGQPVAIKSLRLWHGGDWKALELFQREERVLATLHLNNGAQVRVLEGHGGAISELAIASDGQTLLSAGDDRTVRVWALSGHALHVLEGHRDQVWSVAFSPNGKLAASGSEDGVVILWDVYAGIPLRVFQTQSGGVIDLTFSPDGNLLASAGARGAIQFWWPHERAPWRAPLLPEGFMPADGPASTGLSETAALTLSAREILDSSSAEFRDARDEAEALLQRALEKDPSYAPAHAELARHAYIDGGRGDGTYDDGAVDAAEEHALKAIALDPEHWQGHRALAHVRQIQKRPVEARASIAEAIRLAPDELAAKLELADLDYRTWRWFDALEILRRVIESPAPTHHLADAYAQVGLIYMAMGDYEAADDAYLSLIRIDSVSAWRRGNYADFLLRRRNEPARAAAMARQALAIRNYGHARKVLADAEEALDEGR